MLYAPSLQLIDFGAFLATDELVMESITRPIRELHVAQTEFFSDRGLAHIAKVSGPQLIRLVIQQSAAITSAGLQALAVHQCRSLQKLVLRYCANVTDAGAVDLLRANPHLTVINLKGCDITDITVQALAETCPVQRLSVSLCCRLTNASLESLARYCSSTLQWLHLDGCVQITEEGLNSLSDAPVHSLQSIILNRCVLLTPRSIIRLANQCTNLMCISVNDCPRISRESLASIRLSLQVNVRQSEPADMYRLFVPA